MVIQFLHKSKTEKTMKKVLVSLFVVAALASCNGGATTETVAKDSTVVDSTAVEVKADSTVVDTVTTQVK